MASAIPNGQVIDAPTDHRDIMPTVMSRLGIKPEMPLEGRDLLNYGCRPAYTWMALTSKAGFQEPDPRCHPRIPDRHHRRPMETASLPSGRRRGRPAALRSPSRSGRAETLRIGIPISWRAFPCRSNSAFASRRIVLPSAGAGQRCGSAGLASTGRKRYRSAGRRRPWLPDGMERQADYRLLIQYQAGDGLRA